MSVREKMDALVAWFEPFESCAVAFSAGVDSTVVAKAAHLALGARALAVTADSPSLARGELHEATELARTIGIPHLVIQTAEIHQEAYQRNDARRCFHCKHELYDQMVRLAHERNIEVLVNGANVDDQGDYRPGMQAADQFQVRSPLIECGFSKQDVRDAASAWDLPNWDKPAAPCLSSRLAYGVRVTPERLAMVEQGEQLLRDLGLREFRLRYHEGDLARLEVEPTQIARLAEPALRDRITDQLRRLGFKYVTLDLTGFRSGSLNNLVPIEQLQDIRSK